MDCDRDVPFDDRTLYSSGSVQIYFKDFFEFYRRISPLSVYLDHISWQRNGIEKTSACEYGFACRIISKSGSGCSKSGDNTFGGMHISDDDLFWHQSYDENHESDISGYESSYGGCLRGCSVEHADHGNFSDL